MTRDDDAAIEGLVAAAKAGDAEAYGRIFDHYHEAVHRYIAARVRRPSDAEDLAQLVFVKALEALPRYEQRGVPFGGWLFRLARNVVIDHLRTSREHVELDALVEQTDGHAGPEALALARQQMDEVALALAELTDEQQERLLAEVGRFPYRKGVHAQVLARLSLHGHVGHRGRVVPDDDDRQSWNDSLFL